MFKAAGSKLSDGTLQFTFGKYAFSISLQGYHKPTQQSVEHSANQKIYSVLQR
jgi:hypothetical protein